MIPETIQKALDELRIAIMNDPNLDIKQKRILHFHLSRTDNQIMKEIEKCIPQ